MKVELEGWQLVVSWMAQVIAVLIMVQTLYFKFSGAEEAIFIFSTIGIEPWGRYGTGIAELVAAVLLFIPRYVWFGAIMTFGLMAGALFFHLTILGISIEMDHGVLFELALITLISSVVILILRKKQLPFIN